MGKKLLSNQLLTDQDDGGALVLEDANKYPAGGSEPAARQGEDEAGDKHLCLTEYIHGISAWVV